MRDRNRPSSLHRFDLHLFHLGLLTLHFALVLLLLPFTLQVGIVGLHDLLLLHASLLLSTLLGLLLPLLVDALQELLFDALTILERLHLRFLRRQPERSDPIDQMKNQPEIVTAETLHGHLKRPVLTGEQVEGHDQDATNGTFTRIESVLLLSGSARGRCRRRRRRSRRRLLLTALLLHAGVLITDVNVFQRVGIPVTSRWCLSRLRTTTDLLTCR